MCVCVCVLGSGGVGAGGAMVESQVKPGVQLVLSPRGVKVCPVQVFAFNNKRRLCLCVCLYVL